MGHSEAKKMLKDIKEGHIAGTNRTSNENPQMIKTMIIGSSTGFITPSNYYNGFQPSNSDAARIFFDNFQN